MGKELIINASLPETRIALMEEGEIQELMIERDPLYREVADLVISTEKRTAASVVKDIRRQLELA